MENRMSAQDRKPQASKPVRGEFENAADATGFWFAGVALMAILAAGVILYRTNSSDILTASNDTAVSAQANAPRLR